MNKKNKEILEIEITKVGKFIERPNRFIANIEIEEGVIEEVHVHDSGRIRELLYPGNLVQIRRAKNPNRKTKWDLISGKAEDGEDILINSSFHRYIGENILKDPTISPFKDASYKRAEVKYGKSRIDFLLEKDGQEIWIETKGVSLAEDKVAKFPDAPSVRAVKHLKELIEIKESGKRAAVVLLVFRDSKVFRPKYETDPEFCNWFYKAIRKGVEIYPFQLALEDGKIIYKGLVEIMSEDEVEEERRRYEAQV